MSRKADAWQPGGFNAIIPSTVQKVTVSGSSARTAADFDSQTTIVEVAASVACYIKFGDDTVVATDSDLYLPANTPRMYGVTAQTPRMAALQVTGGGFVTVTEGK